MNSRITLMSTQFFKFKKGSKLFQLMPKLLIYFGILYSPWHSILFSAICLQFWAFMPLKHNDKEKGRKRVLKRESLKSVDWDEVATKCQGPRPNITLSCTNGSNHNSSNSEVISLVHLTSFTNTMCFFSPFRPTYVDTMVFFVHPSQEIHHV